MTEQLNAQQAARKFLSETFNTDDLEGTILRFLNQHFPRTVIRGSDDERTVIRFLSYVLRFASRHVHNVQVQALLGAIYGILNLYGVAGTIAIIRKMQQAQKAKTEKKPDAATM